MTASAPDDNLQEVYHNTTRGPQNFSPVHGYIHILNNPVIPKIAYQP
jgi:hypothetical protein